MAAPNPFALTAGSFIALGALTYCHASGLAPNVVLPLIVGGFGALVATGVHALVRVQQRLAESTETKERGTEALLNGFSEKLREVMELSADQLEAVQGNLQKSIKTMETTLNDVAGTMETSLGSTSKAMEKSLVAIATSLDERLTTNRKELAGALDGIGDQLSFSASGWGGELKEIFKAQQDAQQTAAQDMNQVVKGWQDGLQAQLGDHTKQLEALIGKLGSLSLSSGEEMQKAMVAATGEIGKAIEGWQGRVGGVLSDHATRMEAVSAQLAGQSESGGQELRASMVTASEQLQGSLQTSAKEMGTALTTAAKDLGAKVDAINQIASNIDEVLKISKSTNDALASLTAAGQFKETLDAFRAHLQESDRVLKDVAKPKQFQLVENFSEGGLLEEG